MRAVPETDAVSEGLTNVRGAFAFVGVFSCIVNLLMLTGPLFMLQIYDRVLTSQSVPTLVVLLGLVIGLFAMMGLFDFLRQRILTRAAHAMDVGIAPVTYNTWLQRSIGDHDPGYRPAQDLATIRGFMSSPTVLAWFDLPWFPIYLAVVFLLHVKLGLLALFGACVVVTLAIVNELVTAKPASRAAQSEMVEGRFADQSRAGADSLIAMGMVDNTRSRWIGQRNLALSQMQSATERSEAFTASSKAFRLLLQSAILALGAYLAIGQEITPGAIVAASIIAGRALAPIDQVIGGWRMAKRARMARNRLGNFLKQPAKAHKPVELPDPQGHLSVHGVVKHPPNARAPDSRPILENVTFSLGPGDGLGVIGPSASGKTTLARLLVGLWTPDVGSVRIDGATVEQFTHEKIGRHIGYLPQDATLMPGSVAQNIARFDPDAGDEEIVEAAKIAGVHEMILRIPDGYDTDADTALTPLTGGQRQRIALARAVFRKPRLVVLDEPNSNLDADGDAALAAAIRTLRDSGSVVIVMAHRPSAIAAVDKVLVLSEGRAVEFGDKADVLRKATRVA